MTVGECDVEGVTADRREPIDAGTFEGYRKRPLDTGARTPSASAGRAQALGCNLGLFPARPGQTQRPTIGRAHDRLWGRAIEWQAVRGTLDEITQHRVVLGIPRLSQREVRYRDSN
jgi:hypothetical protein